MTLWQNVVAVRRSYFGSVACKLERLWTIQLDEARSYQQKNLTFFTLLQRFALKHKQWCVEAVISRFRVSERDRLFNLALWELVSARHQQISHHEKLQFEILTREKLILSFKDSFFFIFSLLSRECSREKSEVGACIKIRARVCSYCTCGHGTWAMHDYKVHCAQ